MKNLLWTLICAILFVPALCSCSDDEDKGEYSNWQARNDSYFANIRAVALDSINQAKKEYGDQWEEHCNWRAFLSYKLNAASSNKSTDTTFVRILKRGTGSGCPITSDTTLVYYAGRLIPSESYPDGLMFDHTGQSNDYSKIFDHNITKPSKFSPGAVIPSMGTILQKMHIGDRWMMYSSYQMAYNYNENNAVPAYSSLIFDVELVAYYRKGAVYNY